ncbi:hypothetical protein ACFL57_01250 [Candidatus Margulisiibacteriota bacterium]
MHRYKIIAQPKWSLLEVTADDAARFFNKKRFIDHLYFASARDTYFLRIGHPNLIRVGLIIRWAIVATLADKIYPGTRENPFFQAIRKTCIFLLENNKHSRSQVDVTLERIDDGYLINQWDLGRGFSVDFNTAIQKGFSNMPAVNLSGLGLDYIIKYIHEYNGVLRFTSRSNKFGYQHIPAYCESPDQTAKLPELFAQLHQAKADEIETNQSGTVITLWFPKYEQPGH